MKNFLFLFFGVWLCVVGNAQENKVEPEGFYEMSLEELLSLSVVSASKKSEKVLDAPSNIAVITAQQIKEWGMRDIKDVLRRVSGYQVIADRDEFVFAARGNVSDNNQKYLILIDGHRMNSVENFGPGNIIELPNNLSNVKQIEIIKGPGSAVWGADALAGVINIITKNVDDLKNGNGAGAVAYGSNNYQTYDFQVGTKVSENASIMVSGSLAKQDGRLVKQNRSSGFPIVEGFDEYLNNDGKIEKLDYYHTLLSKQHLSHMLQLKANVGDFTVNALTFETNVNNRHFESEKGRENQLATSKSYLEVAYNKTFGDLQLSAKVGTDINQADYIPVSVDTAVTKTFPTAITWRDRGYTASVEAIYNFADNLSFNSGVEYRSTKLGPNPRLNGVNPSDLSSRPVGQYVDNYLSEEELGAYLMVNYKPIDQISITAGGRASFNNDRGDDAFKVNPRIAVIFFPFENASFKAIYNTGYLRPANFQAVKGDVSSESMTQFDLIWMHQFDKLSYSINYFNQSLDGFIALTSKGGFDFQNLGTYSSSGFEADLSFAASKSTSIWANGSLINAKGSDFAATLPAKDRRVDLEGKLLSYAPLVVNGGLTQSFFNGKLSISPAVRMVGETKYRVINPVEAVINQSDPTKNQPAKDYDVNYRTTPNFVYLDCNVLYDINRNFSVSLYIDNILDIREATHLTVWNGTIEQYGRFAMLKLRANF